MTTEPRPIVTDNGDESITLRLAHDDIVLDAPDFIDFATIWASMLKADESLPPYPPLIDPQDVTAEKLTVRREMVEARSAAAHAVSAPHAQALLDMINLLTGGSYELKDLHRHAGKPIVCNEILGIWDAPLGGPVPSPLPPEMAAALNGQAPPDDEPDSSELEPLRAVWYRRLAPLPPDVIDHMKIWQLAAYAGLDLIAEVTVEERPFVPRPVRGPVPGVMPTVTVY